MKTIKLLSAFLVLIYIGGCSFSEIDRFTSDSFVEICEQEIILGESYRIPDAEFINYNTDDESWAINCEKGGFFHLGSGDAMQTILVWNTSFYFDDQKRIKTISSEWEDLSRIVQSMSVAQRDSLKFNNDPEKIIYELEREFGTSTSINPITWAGQNSKFSLSLSDSKYEPVHTVSVQIK